MVVIIKYALKHVKHVNQFAFFHFFLNLLFLLVDTCILTWIQNKETVI